MYGRSKTFVVKTRCPFLIVICFFMTDLPISVLKHDASTTRVYSGLHSFSAHTVPLLQNRSQGGRSFLISIQENQGDLRLEVFLPVNIWDAAAGRKPLDLELSDRSVQNLSSAELRNQADTTFTGGESCPRGICIDAWDSWAALESVWLVGWRPSPFVVPVDISMCTDRSSTSPSGVYVSSVLCHAPDARLCFVEIWTWNQFLLYPCWKQWSLLNEINEIPNLPRSRVENLTILWNESNRENVSSSLRSIVVESHANVHSTVSWFVVKFQYISSAYWTEPFIFNRADASAITELWLWSSDSKVECVNRWVWVLHLNTLRHITWMQSLHLEENPPWK